MSFHSDANRKAFFAKRNKVYNKYKKSTNMTKGQLIIWSKNPCSRKASLDRRPIRRNLILLSKSKSQWNKKDVREAKKAISFIARHKGQQKGKVIENCGLSKREIALRNWAYQD